MGARDLLTDLAVAGLTVTADGDRLVIRPASRLTDDLRAALRAAKPELMALLSGQANPVAAAGARGCAAAAQPAPTQGRFRLSAADAARCHAVGWNDDEIATFVARHARLLALGLTDGDADDLAEAMTLRDRDGDDRRLCAECAHYRGGRCREAARAGVDADLGELALVLQRCPVFAPAGGER